MDTVSSPIIFKEVSIRSKDAETILNKLNSALMSILGHNGTKHIVLSDFEKEGSVFIIGYLQDIPLCCAGFVRIDSHTGEVKRVFADKNTIGAGTALMRELERWALAHDYTHMLLECREQNKHALDFYHRIGYRNCDKFPPYDNEDDAVCMEKYLVFIR